MFPTKLCESLVRASEVDKLFKDPHAWKVPLGQFQRLSLVTDYDTAIKAVVPHLDVKPSKQHVLSLKMIHEISKNDILSIAMERLVDVVESSRSDKEKVSAATIINELYGDKDLIKDVKLTDRLLINLVGNDNR